MRFYDYENKTRSYMGNNVLELKILNHDHTLDQMLILEY